MDDLVPHAVPPDAGLATLKRFEKIPHVIPVVGAATFAALAMAGVEFQDDGKRLGVNIVVRKLAKQP